MSVTQALLDPLLADSAARPLITHYDDANGARVELSRATMANWAAKTANWLVDELDVEPGTPVAMLLPAHWQTAGALLGTWWCGARVTDDPRGAEVAFVPASNPASGTGAYTLAVAGLDPLGAPSGNLPDGGVDYVSDVRVHGDDFTPRTRITGDTPALLDSTVDDVVARCAQRAEELRITRQDRVLSTLDWTLPDGVIDGLLTILHAHASLVQCANPDRDKLDKRRADERITNELGIR